MKKSKATKALEKIALREGISVKEVRFEIQKVIDAAYENRNKDEFSTAFWGKWGRKPSPEEFIVEASSQVLDKLNLPLH